jgi:hypothetical protein
VKRAGKNGGGTPPEQLELGLSARAPEPAPEINALKAELQQRKPGLRVIQGGAQGPKQHEKLSSRDAVVRVLVEAGADLLLRRISPERAEHIEGAVNKILDLFDRVDGSPTLMPVLQRQLDDLESLMTETRSTRSRRQG